MHLSPVEHFYLQLPWREILAIGYHLDFHLSDLKFCLKPYDVEFFICEVTQATILTHFHKYGAWHLTHGVLLTTAISTHQDEITSLRMCPNRRSPDYPIEDSPQTLKHQYTTTLPLALATTPFLPWHRRTKWPPWTKRPITHQHRVTATKVSSRLTDKDSKPPV